MDPSIGFILQSQSQSDFDDEVNLNKNNNLRPSRNVGTRIATPVLIAVAQHCCRGVFVCLGPMRSTDGRELMERRVRT